MWWSLALRSPECRHWHTDNMLFARFHNIMLLNTRNSLFILNILCYVHRWYNIKIKCRHQPSLTVSAAQIPLLPNYWTHCETRTQLNIFKTYTGFTIYAGSRACGKIMCSEDYIMHTCAVQPYHKMTQWQCKRMRGDTCMYYIWSVVQHSRSDQYGNSRFLL